MILKKLTESASLIAYFFRISCAGIFFLLAIVTVPCHWHFYHIRSHIEILLEIYCCGLYIFVLSKSCLINRISSHYYI